MQPEDIAVLFRGVERVIITIIAGSTIYWGFRLFALALPTDNEFSAGKGNFTLKMRRIGPGVLFALFGAVILSINLLRPISLRTPDIDISHIGSGPAPIAVNTDQSIRRVKAINTILNHLSGIDSSSIATASSELTSLKIELIDSIYGDGSYKKVVLLNEPINSIYIQPSDRKLIESVNSLNNALF